MKPTQEILSLLKEAKTIAVVGLSDNPSRPSHGVAKYLQSVGYRIIPVNPTLDSVLGEKAYRSLSEIPPQIDVDIVDIFRRSSEVPPVVEAAIQRRVKCIWMQLGVLHEAAYEKGVKAGIPVIMNACIAIEHRQMQASSGLRPQA